MATGSGSATGVVGGVYPAGSDLSTFLTSTELALDSISSDQFDAAMLASAAEWESRSGYTPFIATTQTRTYDPPGPERGPVGLYFGVNNIGGSRKLPLNTGLLTLTELRVGVSPANVGTVLTVNRDFWLRQQNAPQYGRPYTSIEFAVPQWGNPQSITVAGSFGFCSSLPLDVSNALLNNGAYLLGTQLALAISGGLYSERRLNSEVRYAGSKMAPLTQEMEVWRGVFNATVQRYQRPRMA